MKTKACCAFLTSLIWIHAAAADPTPAPTAIVSQRDRLLRKAKVERAIGYSLDGLATALMIAGVTQAAALGAVEGLNTEHRMLQTMTGMIGTAGLIYIAGSILIYRSALNDYRAKRMEVAPFGDAHGGGLGVQLRF